MPKEPEQDITIKDLYPDLTPEEQEAAEQNLRAYCFAVANVFQRRFHVKASESFNEIAEQFRPEDDEQE